jgi:hypothetical protein
MSQVRILSPRPLISNFSTGLGYGSRSKNLTVPKTVPVSAREKLAECRLSLDANRRHESLSQGVGLYHLPSKCRRSQMFRSAVYRLKHRSVTRSIEPARVPMCRRIKQMVALSYMSKGPGLQHEMVRRYRCRISVGMYNCLV